CARMALAEYTITSPSDTSASTAHSRMGSNRTAGAAGVFMAWTSERLHEPLERVAAVLEVLELIVRRARGRQQHRVAGLRQLACPPHGRLQRAARVHGRLPLVRGGDLLRVL